jgi:hypothetical protein
MNSQDKKYLRKVKREIKRSGNKRVRSQIKREIEENPDVAHMSEQDFGGFSSEIMNGMDYDSKRKKKKRERDEKKQMGKE